MSRIQSFAIDELIESVEGRKNIRTSPMYQFKLGNRSINRNTRIFKDDSFESGMIKIQGQEMEALTNDENTTCEKLKERRMAQSRYRLRRRPYLNESLLKSARLQRTLTTAVEIERLWSLAKNDHVQEPIQAEDQHEGLTDF